MTRVLVLLAAGVLSAGPVVGASPDPKDLAIPPQELSRARDLVRKLGSEVYREREDAQAELARMGRLARPALLEAVASDADPEVRFRCSRLLPKAGADELKARLDTFLADADGKYEHDLPGLRQFRKQVGTDKAARDLFVEVVKSPYNVEVLQALDRGAVEAGRAIADRRTLLFSDMQQHRLVPGRPAQPPRQPTLADVACLLFAETLTPAKDIPRVGMWSGVSGVTFVQQATASVQTLSNPNAPHADAYKRVVAAWMETRDDVNELAQLSYVAGQQLRGFPQSLPLLRKIVTTDGVYGYAKAQAINFLVQQKGKDEIPFLKGLLANDALVTTVWFGGNNGQNEQHQSLLRDVALAQLVVLTGQRMEDYGYKFPPGFVPNNQNIGYGNYAFPTPEARAAAMVKFGMWQLKNGPAGPAPKDAGPAPAGPPRPQK
jgi:hypothetical protein